MSSAPEPVVGIDLGTTFSVVSFLDAQGRPVTITNSEGDLTTPSVVFLDATGAVVGKEAVKSAEFEPDRVAPYPKRDMGGELFHRAVRGAYFRPEVLQALVLRKLKQDAELRLGPVTKCVITVPAYFNEPRRKATQDAGRMAGWEVLDIINEPTAAAIAYGVHRGFLSPTGPTTSPETILVYDLGGGTFDVTLMHVEHNCFTTLATAGDVELGGIDWDNRIVDLLAERFLAEHGLDPRADAATLFRLKREAEDVKRSLSTKTDVNVLFAYEGKRLRTTVTRAEFENCTGDLVDRTIMTLRKLLREAKRTYMEVSRLLVVGGSSRMPMIREALEKETGFTVDHPLSVDEAVAHGAALYARYLQDKAATGSTGFAVRNVNSHTLGVLGIEPSTMMRRRKIMIARNTPLPAQHTQRFVTAAAGQKSVVVTVIEGGDDSGNHSTLIGRCILDGLAPNLPPRSQVDVTFVYSDNGRLEVRAFMPAVERDSVLTIERAKGMSPELLQAWAASLATGLPDGAALPEEKQPTTPEQKSASGPAATANPLHAPELKRMPKQVDVVETISSTEPPKEVVLDAVAEITSTTTSSVAASSATIAPSPKSKPAEAKLPEKKPAALTSPAAPTTAKSTPAAAAPAKPAAPANSPAPSPSQAKPPQPSAAPKLPSEFDFAEPVHDVADDAEAFSVDPNKKRKKKKKPPEGQAPGTPPAEEPKKKPGWKFW